MKKDMMKELQKASKKPAKQPTSGRPSKTCLFSLDDVFKTNNMLSRLLRGICIKKNITLKQVEDALRKIVLRQGRSSKEVHSEKSNLVSATGRPSVSFNKTVELLHTVLGYRINITISLTDKDGNTEHFSYEDVYQEMLEMKRKQEGK